MTEQVALSFTNSAIASLKYAETRVSDIRYTRGSYVSALGCFNISSRFSKFITMLSDGTFVDVIMTNYLAFGIEGRVYQGKFRDTDQPIAIKCIQQWQKQLARLKETLEFCKTLQHPNIVRHLHHQEYRWVDSCEPPVYQVIMELCKGGTLRQTMKRIVITPHLLQKWTREIVEGLAYLHKMSCVHRDIKGENILMTSRNLATSSVKIADLTTLTRSDDGTRCGTYRFMAPEMLADRNPETDEAMPTRGPPADIWSLGCVVIEMLNGTSPVFFREHNGNREQIQNDLALQLFVVTGGSPTIPTGLPPDVELFIRDCLKRDPHERKCAAELRSHSFLTAPANTLLNWVLPEPIGAMQESTELQEFTVGTQRIIPVQLVRKVARGRGNVYQADRTDTGDTVAVKSFLLDVDPEIRKKEIKLLEAELEILMPLHHPNIVSYIHRQEGPLVSVYDPPTYQILLEFCEGPTLLNFIEKSPVPPLLLQKWIKQLVDGIVYLHSQQRVHRNICHLNTMLSSNDIDECLVKICGFGMMGRLTKDATNCEPPYNYPRQTTPLVCSMSPEAISCMLDDDEPHQAAHTVGKKTDIWSLGCLVIAMILGDGPHFYQKGFDGQIRELSSDMAILQFVKTGGSPTIPEHLPEKIDDFIKECIQHDPSDRLHAVGLKKHAFLTAAREEVSNWLLPPRPRLK